MSETVTTSKSAMPSMALRRSHVSSSSSTQRMRLAGMGTFPSHLGCGRPLAGMAAAGLYPRRGGKDRAERWDGTLRAESNLSGGGLAHGSNPRLTTPPHVWFGRQSLCFYSCGSILTLLVADRH